MAASVKKTGWRGGEGGGVTNKPQARVLALIGVLHSSAGGEGRRQRVLSFDDSKRTRHSLRRVILIIQLSLGRMICTVVEVVKGLDVIIWPGSWSAQPCFLNHIIYPKSQQSNQQGQCSRQQMPSLWRLQSKYR